MIQLPFEPGVIAAFVFVMFDILLLSLVDTVIAHVVSVSYYRQVFAGQPLTVTSADIPGVTTNLIGKFTSLTNFLALSVKLLLISVVFVINLDIAPSITNQYSTQTRSAVFLFDASATAWPSDTYTTVQRRHSRLRFCRHVDAAAGHISYYQVAFNLRDEGVDLQHDATHNFNEADKYDIRDSSIQCLAPKLVKHPVRVATVVGCSQLETTSCPNGTTIFRPIVGMPDLNAGSLDVNRAKPYTLPGTKLRFWIAEYSAEEVRATWPEYVNPTLTCAEMNAGSEIRRKFLNCVLKSRNGTHTLVEYWAVKPTTQSEDEEERARKLVFVRKYPGAIFATDMDISTRVLTRLFESVTALDANWITISSLIVADAAVYQGRPVTFDYVERTVTYTNLRTGIVILALIFLVGAVVARVVVGLTLGRDVKPRFNTIDGLSSILREEYEPVRGCLKQGLTALVGFKDRCRDVRCFGPVCEADECVSGSDDTSSVDL